jgi:hypothetical protein
MPGSPTRANDSSGMSNCYLEIPTGVILAALRLKHVTLIEVGQPARQRENDSGQLTDAFHGKFSLGGDSVEEKEEPY